MPARPRTALKAAAAVKATSEPVGTFARLRAQAQKQLPAISPYVIDDVTPPIEIGLPSSVEQQIGIAELFGSDGSFRTRDARRILQLICGDEFPRVWELVKGEHINVLVDLIAEMGEHFGGALTGGAEDYPGGSGASPN